MSAIPRDRIDAALVEIDKLAALYRTEGQASSTAADLSGARWNLGVAEGLAAAAVLLRTAVAPALSP